MYSPTKINICISYDQRLMAEGLASVLSKVKEIQVLEVTTNRLATLLERIRVNKPELMITELSYISPQGIEIVKRIRQAYPQLKVLIVSGLVCHNFLETLMHLVNGYLLRTCSSSKLILAIHEIMDSGKYLCPKLINTLMEKDQQDQIHQALTLREKEILSCWVKSENTMQIAKALNISTPTVRTHLKNIRAKFGSSNPIRMMIHACKENMLNGDYQPLCPFCKSFCTLQSEILS
ncbi:LuxR C-terminal-related transcriptional regulator [Sunxiuqinia sp. sy24]|uniref:LuxR C-terminal-related transcriptional regulator n=1 Tax=Sunxiuqinia sp. sy24 TaxID=3461495 RepID=UPI00404546BF